MADYIDKIVVIGVSSADPIFAQKIVSSVSLGEGNTLLYISHLEDYVMAQFLSDRNTPFLSIRDGETINSGRIYLAMNDIDDDKHPEYGMGLSYKTFEIEKRGNQYRFLIDSSDPWDDIIDQVFRSVAREFKERTIGIVLPGAGPAGSKGIQEIKKYGGVTMVLDPKYENSSMQHNAISTGMVDYVLSIDEIIVHLEELLKDN